jgi:hypothetical protein
MKQNRKICRWLLLTLSAVVSGGARAAELLDRFPDNIHAGERYVIYSHGFIVEGNDPQPVSPKYGQYDFPGIKRALFSGEASI